MSKTPLCVCVCVRVCVSAHARACLCVCVVNFYTPLIFLQFLSIVSKFHKYYENTQKIIRISDSPEKTLMAKN